MGVFRRFSHFPKTSQLISHWNLSDSKTPTSEFDDMGKLIAKEAIILIPFSLAGPLQHNFPSSSKIYFLAAQIWAASRLTLPVERTGSDIVPVSSLGLKKTCRHSSTLSECCQVADGLSQLRLL